jgi:DNA (cytosine-5)-methyltransferase 1
MRTVAFCEIDPYCRAVLHKHWPAVPCFEDVRNLRAEHVGRVDLICGGFPCQDISLAGKGGGLAGARSGLWSEFRRLIEECRPSWAVIENVSALRSRGLDQVLGEISALGYDAEWHCIPASAVGAPHRRDRIWIVAHPDLDVGFSCRLSAAIEEARRWNAGGSGVDADVAHAHGHDEHGRCGAVQMGRLPIKGTAAPDGDAARTQWAFEPDVGRVVNGVPSRVDRLRCLGNAVIPQIVEAIGRAIMRTPSA